MALERSATMAVVVQSGLEVDEGDLGGDEPSNAVDSNPRWLQKILLGSVLVRGRYYECMWLLYGNRSGLIVLLESHSLIELIRTSPYIV